MKTKEELTKILATTRMFDLAGATRYADAVSLDDLREAVEQNVSNDAVQSTPSYGSTQPDDRDDM